MKKIGYWFELCVRNVVWAVVLSMLASQAFGCSLFHSKDYGELEAEQRQLAQWGDNARDYITALEWFEIGVVNVDRALRADFITVREAIEYRAAIGEIREMFDEWGSRLEDGKTYDATDIMLRIDSLLELGILMNRGNVA